MENIKKIESGLKNQERLEKRQKLSLPSYTITEEVLNATTHGIGIILSIIAIIVVRFSVSSNAKIIACISVYIATLFILYTISTLYHALGINKAKKVFRILDHCSIFVLISGTYTPICLLMLNNSTGWVLFSIVWIVAVIGIVFNSIDLKKFSKLSLACYIIMGWSVIFAIKPLIAVATHDQLMFLFCGGIIYTLGAVLYVLGKKMKYMHSIWHVFVLAGSISHFLMIYNFIKTI